MSAFKTNFTLLCTNTIFILNKVREFVEKTNDDSKKCLNTLNDIFTYVVTTLNLTENYIFTNALKPRITTRNINKEEILLGLSIIIETVENYNKGRLIKIHSLLVKEAKGKQVTHFLKSWWKAKKEDFENGKLTEFPSQDSIGEELNCSKSAICNNEYFKSVIKYQVAFMFPKFYYENYIQNKPKKRKDEDFNNFINYYHELMSPEYKQTDEERSSISAFIKNMKTYHLKKFQSYIVSLFKQSFFEDIKKPEFEWIDSIKNWEENIERSAKIYLAYVHINNIKSSNKK